LNREEIISLNGACQVAGRSGTAPQDWQTGVIISMYKRKDWRACTNRWDISFHGLVGKVHVKCPENRCLEIPELKTGDYPVPFSVLAVA